MTKAKLLTTTGRILLFVVCGIIFWAIVFWAGGLL